MVGIDIWCPADMNMADNLIVLYDDRDAFEYCSEIYTGSKVYKLGKNSGVYSDLICAVIAFSNSLPLTSLPKKLQESKDYKFVSIFTKIIESFTSLNKYEFIRNRNMLNSLECSSQIYDRATHLIDNLEETLSLIYGGVYEDGLYYYTSADCWWKQSPIFGNKLSELYIRLEGSNLPIKNELQDAISYLQRSLSILSGRNTPKILKVVSAYFMVLAKHFNDSRHYNIAYLTVHRAIDLYFTSVGIENGFIREQRDFLIYHDDNPNDYGINKKPSLYLFKTYKHYISILLALGTTLESAVYEINTKRNKLMFAHGVESASMFEARTAYINSLEILERDTEWCSYKRCFCPTIELRTSEIITDIFNTNHHVDI